MKTKIALLSFLFSITLFAQELPPIVKYAPTTYGAGNQNWMISQDSQQFILFANNEGLLEFNGSSWQLYPSPNETIIRSVKVIGDKIYTGSYMEFGFWKHMNDGKLKYQSLSASIKKYIRDDEQFWNILHYDHWVIFQSLDRIYVFDTKTGKFRIIAPSATIIKAFKTTNGLYYQVYNEGLYEIEAGKSTLKSSHPVFKNNRIVNVFSNENGLLVVTESNGFYQLSGNQITKFSTEADKALESSSIYSCEKLTNGGIAIGTVSNGIFILTKEGKLNYHISQSKGLSNNTALSLFEDAEKNLWIGLDNGINCINLQSPIQSYVDDSGILGTIYTSKLHDGWLYVGTNQGLFYKKYRSNEDFKFVSGTKGQVWTLFAYDGTLFCGHDRGTYVVQNGSIQSIFSQSGTWKLNTVPGQKDILLQGNYYGISVLERRGGQWYFRNKLEGFDYSSKYFEITDAFEIYVSHEYKGVFRLATDARLAKINTFTTYKHPTKGKNASLVKFNNAIYYAYKEGVFKLNAKTKEFHKDALLSTVFEKDEYTSGKMIVDETHKIWLFSKNYTSYYAATKLSDQLKQNSIPIPASLTNSMLGYENITHLANSDYLFGTTDGYYTMNIDDLVFKNYKVSISNITTNRLNASSRSNPIQTEGIFAHDENNISFSFTVPEYNKYINPEYQYILEGFQDDWSNWNTRSNVNFKNLPSGEYVFKLKAKFANSNLDTIVTYSFTIKKPWYGTNLAICMYFVLLLLFSRFMHNQYTSYYLKKEQKLIEENNLLLEIQELENQQQLMRLKNEQLSQDVDSMNKELAASTMSLNSKNELLALIQEDLKKTEASDSRSIKSVISTINKNITKNDAWSVFQEAFDKTDKDFLKKIKEAHPSLTANDLKLCAYLRLNLSSKEIAPLLNISVRSVEIKRYRLRKKMDLAHEQGLVEYILSV
ncbi:triple tyrosine motif-containing protein [Flavobacterium sp. UMI-01]|uniref:helix-turn-helix and ligand-binding sensor domain-containing protein n=1 Tax=Flavobacterium sp. UMI-01 TaxID=1441053 RepID=UPI00207EABAF|nr:triple tyrosine motif-containing protein [Flavobacterium sp. UMI-01]GIZ10527.1 hypothetical protein FUMI01_32510 [Flavobacterium sp. UMI-01]